MLDVGTNNEKLLTDPMYMGWRHQRIEQDKYDEFLAMFIDAVKRRWPDVLLQFEDFAQPNATPLLNRYRNELCCFNDDIQGTASVTVGTLLAACRTKRSALSEQRVVFVGAGSAGCGIAEQIISQMVSEGIGEQQARSQIFMVDRFGLLTEGMAGLRDFQEKLVQQKSAIALWNVQGDYASLLDVMHGAEPTILIGVSGVPGLFTEAVIKAMKAHCHMPIIFPLSNPSRQVEATPEQVINWTEGEVIIATGSPFEPVEYKGQMFPIAQCNNSYVFPGIGLGVVSAKINRITDEMLMAASAMLAQASPLANTGTGELLPPLVEIAALSKKIAFAVAKVAFEQNLALPLSDEQLMENIERNFWTPQYRQYRRVSI
jgi:malate dehydrogenase (oxaloacetate-decarboxylating)